VGTEAEDQATPAARAATSLRYLAAAQTAPRARPSDGPRRTRPSTPAAPIHPGILDHVTAARREVVEHARAVIPEDLVRGPVPREAVEVYRWYEQHTPYLDAGARRAGEAIMYRQALEHALRARDTTVIRRERCPSCRCFSLLWQGALQAAVCVNDRDLHHGRPRRYTLAQLAETAVGNSSMRAAT